MVKCTQGGDIMTFEELQEAYLKLQEDYKTAQSNNETLSADNESMRARVTELQEHNQKLFLRITSPSNEKKEEDEEKPKSTEDLSKELLEKGVI